MRPKLSPYDGEIETFRPLDMARNFWSWTAKKSLKDHSGLWLITGQRDLPGTERDYCPDMPEFVVPREFSNDCPVAMCPANPRDWDRDWDPVAPRDYRPSLA